MLGMGTQISISASRFRWKMVCRFFVGRFVDDCLFKYVLIVCVVFSCVGLSDCLAGRNGRVAKGTTKSWGTR